MSLIKSLFLKNVLALFKGNVFFQVTIILTLIFLARHYTPEQIGRYAVFISIISIISTVAPGRLEMAIMLPENAQKAHNIFLSSLSIILIVCFIFLIVSLVLFSFSIFFTEFSGLIIILVVLGIFFAAINLLEIQYLNRHEMFNVVSNGKIITAIVIAFAQVLSVFYFKDVFYLVLSYMLGFLVSAVFYFIKLKPHIKKFNHNINKIKPTLLEYKSFPTLNNISSLFNIVANQGPVIFIEAVYGSAISGFYSVVQRTLNAPASLIGSAFSQVFYKKITGKTTDGETKKFMKSSIKYLILLATVIFVVVIFFSDLLYVFVFGKEYIISAKIAKIMVLFFLVRLIFSSMSTLIIAKKKLALDLKFNIFYALSLITPILISYIYNFNYTTLFILITCSGTLCFLFLGYLLFKKV